MRLHPRASESVQGTRLMESSGYGESFVLLATLVQRLPGCLEESAPLHGPLWCWHILPETWESRTAAVVLGENMEQHTLC